MLKKIRIGLKNNASWLFEATKNQNLGGYSDGIYHNQVVVLNDIQFEKFKRIIKECGYSIERSLLENTIDDSHCDYSCYLKQ